MRLCDQSISGDMLSSGKFMAGALYQASEQCQSRVRKSRQMGSNKEKGHVIGEYASYSRQSDHEVAGFTKLITQ